MKDEILKLESQLCFRLYALSRNMTRLYQPYLDKFNLTYPQYVIMLVLFEKKSIDFKELSDIVELKTGTLTPILQKIEKLGYIKRIKNSLDARKIDIVLTDMGFKLKTDIIEVPVTMNEELKITDVMYKNLVKELDGLSSVLKYANNKN